MAVALDALGPGTVAAGATARTVSWAHTCSASATALIAGISMGAGSANIVTSVTYAGSPLTLVSYRMSGTGVDGGGEALYYLFDPPSGAGTVSASVSTSTTISGASLSFTGSSTIGTPLTVSTVGANAATSISGTMPTTTTGGIIALGACFGGSGGGTFSGVGSTTVEWHFYGNESSAAGYAVGGLATSTGSSQVVGFSSNVGDDSWGMVAVEVQPASGGSESGPFTITLPSLAVGLAGSVTESGPLAVTLPVLSVSLTGHVTESGPLAIVLPSPKVTLAGSVTAGGPFSITLPSPAVSLAGSVSETGLFAIALPVPRISLTGSIIESGPLAITLPPLKVILTGTVTASGPLAIALPKPAVSITGHVSETGPLSITLPPLAVSLAGSVSGNVTSTFAIDLPVPRASLAGVLDHKGPFAPVLPAPKTSLAGNVNQHETGEFAITLPSLAVSLSSAIDEIFSTFNIWLPGGDVIPVLTELAASIPAPSVSIEGFIGTIGELTIALPLPEVSITGIDYHSALDIVLPPPAINWTGTDYYSRLDIALPSPRMSWTGTDGHVGEFSILFGRTPMMMLARFLRLDRLRRLFNPNLTTLGEDTNWTTGSPGTNWITGTPGTEWSVAYTSAQITSLSTQYVLVPISATKAGAAYNPTADPVQFAFAPTPTYVPQDSDWVSGSWQTVSTSLLYPYSAQCLIGPTGATVLTTGTYVIYVQITDNPETPVLTAGQLIVT